MNKSVYKKIGIAAVIMMASVFLSRVIGLLREIVIAGFAGTGPEVDSYQIAFILPEIMNHIAASGFLSVTFIPIFTGYLASNKEDEGWKVFSIILNVFGILLILLIIAAEIFTPELINLTAPGLKDVALKAKAVKMTRIILPAQFFFFAGGLLMAVQFAKERFFLPALSPLIYNIGIILGGILLYSKLGMEGFSWGVLAGAFAGSFALQIFGAFKVGVNYRAIFDIRHPALKKYIVLTLPLMVGLTMTFSTEFFLRFFGSYLPEGSIAGLNYSMRLMFVIAAFSGQALGTASFPFMAKLAAEGKIKEMNRLLDNSIKYIALVIPLSAFIIVLRYQVIVMVFQRGSFDQAASALCSQTFMFIMAGAFAFAAQTVVVRGFFALQKTFMPAVFGTFASILSILFYILGLHFMGAKGVAWAVSLSAIVQVTLLYLLWTRKKESESRKNMYFFYIKMLSVSVFMVAVLEPLKRVLTAFIDTYNFAGSFLISFIISLCFAGLFALICCVFKIREISDLLPARLSR